MLRLLLPIIRRPNGMPSWGEELARPLYMVYVSVLGLPILMFGGYVLFLVLIPDAIPGFDLLLFALVVAAGLLLVLHIVTQRWKLVPLAYMQAVIGGPLAIAAALVLLARADQGRHHWDWFESLLCSGIPLLGLGAGIAANLLSAGAWKGAAQGLADASSYQRPDAIAVTPDEPES